MTPRLRKIHRYTWFAFAVLLPLGWLAAIWAIPGEVWMTPIQASQPPALVEVVRSKESGDFVLNLRQDSAGRERQIEIFIKKPLPEAGTLVFWRKAEAGDFQLLGALQTRGVYRFALDSLSGGVSGGALQFEDPLHQRVLRTIQF